MKYSKLTCPNCGAGLRITKELNIATIAYCDCCNTEFTLEEGPEEAYHVEQMNSSELIYGLDELSKYIEASNIELQKKRERREQYERREERLSKIRSGFL